MIFILGPCVIESEAHCRKMAGAIREQTILRNIPLIFKASFDKANRTSKDSYRGPGIKEGLRILGDLKRDTGIAVTSDIHEVWQAAYAKPVLNVIQIPALLCRQTSLIEAAAKTGRPINIKKGQFMAPEDMIHAVGKVRALSPAPVMVTERGTTFGYRNLVVDMTAFARMKDLGCQIIFDASHSVQRPGAGEGRSTGNADLIEPLALAAIAAGADGIFCEVHDDPAHALSDGPNSLPLSRLPDFLDRCLAVAKAAG